MTIRARRRSAIGMRRPDNSCCGRRGSGLRSMGSPTLGRRCSLTTRS